MKIKELEKALLERGVRARSFSIDGAGEDEEQYRLERSGGRWWCAYYYERGNRNEVREFPSEEEACDYFLELVLSDPTSRR
ncbi:hypothetical protein JQ628_02745 [Bradyrhizobium lablabi]|uniref:hypothetical protein n=1 Tax=Bradyrhizobium lablabi TaxID=722472 RepID=UPI001BAB58F4|nr:hypothetical protein [Bradyrhizobium lablabi]MBR1120420.1 hypothetical protein [Bradyrhizobium lablabi]